MGLKFKREVKSAQLGTLQLYLELDGAGAALDKGSNEASLTDNGVGDFSIAFEQQFERAPIVLVSPMESDTAVYAESVTASGCDIKVTDLSAVAKDARVSILVVGFEYSQEY